MHRLALSQRQMPENGLQGSNREASEHWKLQGYLKGSGSVQGVRNGHVYLLNWRTEIETAPYPAAKLQG